MSISLRMKVQSAEVRDATPKSRHVDYHLRPTPGNNESWSVKTPAGSFQFSLTNPKEALLQDGAEYTVTIELAKPSAKPQEKK